MTNATETVSIRDEANAVSDQKVRATIKKIEESIARRDTFEADNGLDLNATSSWSKAKAKMTKASVALARMFAAFNVEPKNVIERKVQANKMFNAKALEKVVEIAHFVCGNNAKVQHVTRAFLACVIAASDKKIDVITNDVNVNFLNSRDFGSMIKDQELLAKLDELRKKSMSSGAATQSSQVRNVLDVLGIAQITGETANHARGAIKLNRDHAFVSLVRETLLKSA